MIASFQGKGKNYFNWLLPTQEWQGCVAGVIPMKMGINRKVFLAFEFLFFLQKIKTLFLNPKRAFVRKESLIFSLCIIQKMVDRAGFGSLAGRPSVSNALIHRIWIFIFLAKNKNPPFEPQESFGKKRKFNI